MAWCDNDESTPYSEAVYERMRTARA
jgi:hypothetical protein